jgi:hypothetical protein
MYLDLGIATNNTATFPVLLNEAARARHIYIAGQTGTGKSALLENIAAQLLRAGEAIAVIDPHGDLAQACLAHVPLERRHELCYFDLSDIEHPIGWNPIKDIVKDDRSRVADNIVMSFIHIWGSEAVGNRSQQVLRNALRLLMANPDTSLLDIERLLTDNRYRTSLYRTAPTRVRRYWTEQFDRYDPRKVDDVMSPMLNKLDGLLSNDAVQNILAGGDYRLSIQKVMDERRILIANLAKGQTGEQAAHFVGSILVSAITASALARAKIPEGQRQPFALIADEFQSFANAAFPTVLSEARKYKLMLVAAHQFVQQVPEPIQEAIFGNVGNWLAFRVGADDAPKLAKHFGIDGAAAFTELPNYTAWVRPMVDGAPGNVHLLATHPPPNPLHDHVPELIENSRRHFARRRADVEARIDHELGKDIAAIKKPALRWKNDGRSAMKVTVKHETVEKGGRLLRKGSTYNQVTIIAETTSPQESTAIQRGGLHQIALCDVPPQAHLVDHDPQEAELMLKVTPQLTITNLYGQGHTHTFT